MMSKEVLKKLYCFGCICLYALAAIGGVTYLFTDHHAVFAVAAGLAVFKTAKTAETAHYSLPFIVIQ